MEDADVKCHQKMEREMITGIRNINSRYLELSAVSSVFPLIECCVTWMYKVLESTFEPHYLFTKLLPQ